MIVGMDRHLATTEAAVTACRALAAAYAREIEVTHDIGADQTSRRSSVGVGVTTEGHKEPLIAKTDAALYRAKHGGKNRTERADPATSPWSVASCQCSMEMGRPATSW